MIRYQFPPSPAAAKTIRKSQGDTVNEVVINMACMAVPHAHYVVLIRVTTRSGLHITKLNETKIKVTEIVKTEMHRIKQEATTTLCYSLWYC